MGIRMYQEVGLKLVAKDFLDKNVNMIVDKITTCPHCHKEVSTTMKREVISILSKDYFYENGPTLRIYRLRNGGVAKEVVQALPWSSGPVAFMCLEVDGVRMFEWTDKEIEENS